MAKQKYVWFGSVDKFGYMLECIGTSEQQVKDALTKAYIEAFKNANDGMDPAKEYKYSEDDGETYLDCFYEDLVIEKRAIGEVEWR